MKKRPSPQNHERGQSLVEFAISLTAILILLAGAVDFGIALFHYIAMRDAAQEGALFGSMNPDNNAGIIDRAANSSGSTGLIGNLYASGDLTIAITYSGAHCEGNGITVTLVYNYPITMPFIGGFIGSNTIRLTASETDTILTPVCP
jgi:Flp pilus assembly protein TadG